MSQEILTETVLDEIVNVDKFKKELADYVKSDAKNKLIQCFNNLIKKNINKGYCVCNPLTINFQGIECQVFKFPVEFLDVIKIIEEKFMLVGNDYLIFDPELIKSTNKLVEEINDKNRILINTEKFKNSFRTEDLCNILSILTKRRYDISIIKKNIIECIKRKYY